MSPSLPRPQQANLTSLLEAAGVHHESSIRVTGADGLPLLLWLCRHGYEHVGYVRSDQRGPRELSDAVLVAQTCEPTTLAKILAAGPMVAEGGVFVVQAHVAPSGLSKANPYRRLLEAAGYGELTCVQGLRRELHIARRRLTSMPRKAA